MSKRTVQDVEGGRRRGREDYEEEGEQSEAGSGIQRADAATLAQRRLLRIRPGAAGQQQQQQGGGAFANINSGTTSNSANGSEDRFKQSAESAGKPFTWGAGFYNPPQPKIPAPSYDLVNGGDIDNKAEKDAEFDDEKKDDKNKKDKNEDASTASKSSSAAPGWTANPFTASSSSAAASSSNPFAPSTSSSNTAAAGTSASSSSANPFNSSSSASFTFSFAPPPSSMPSASSSSSSATTTATTAGADASNNNKNGKSALAAAPTVSTTEASETEKVIYETEHCKLYLFFKDEETKQSSWKERGGGSFKIVQFIEKDHQDEQQQKEKNTTSSSKAWLVMRNPQTRKVILSCPVDESLKIGQTQEMQLMFTSAAALDIYGGPPPKDAVQSFLLRANKAASKDIIATAVKHIKEQQERVQ